VAVFISLAAGDAFRLDAVEIKLDGKPVAQHLYTFKELEALQKGGCSASIPATCAPASTICRSRSPAKSSGGADFRKTENFTDHQGSGSQDR
jgi:hypothetical protein